MTVSSQTSRIEQLGDGTTTAFAVNFYFLENSDLKVFVDGVLQTITTNYTVTGAGNPAGGAVTFVSAPANGVQVVIFRDPALTQGLDYIDNDPFPAESHERGLDKLTMIAQRVKDLVSRALRLSDSVVGVNTELPALSGGQLLGTNPGGTGFQLYPLGSEPDTAANIVYTPAGTGVVATTVEAKLRERKDAVNDYGADPTGGGNSTVALFNFFIDCLAGVPGHIPQGVYTVDLGVLDFDNGHIDTPFLNVTTDGPLGTIFQNSADIDAPFLKFTNGVALSGAGQYWFGGYLGGIGFKRVVGSAVNTAQHGLVLRGFQNTNFGLMRGDDLGGDAVHIEQQLFGGTNPDPYHVIGCRFDGFFSVNCEWALNNQNFVGFSFNEIGYVLANQNRSGGWFGIGSGNFVERYGVSNSLGWAIDDVQVSTGGSSSRLVIEVAEFDNPENGVRLNLIQQVEIKFLRVIHRFQSGLNTDPDYWPRSCFDFGSLLAANVSDVTISAFHRIEAGGVLANLGSLANFNNNSNVNTVSIDHRIADNGGLGVTDADLFDALNSGFLGNTIKNRGRLVADRSVKIGAYVGATSAQTVPNSGIGTAGARIAFPTELYDGFGYYSTVSNEFTVPYDGLYRLSGALNLALPVGTRLRMEFTRDRSGVLAPVIAKAYYSGNAAAQAYSMEGTVLLLAGDKVSMLADQNTAGAINLSVVRGASAENYWSIFAV